MLNKKLEKNKYFIILAFNNFIVVLFCWCTDIVISGHKWTGNIGSVLFSFQLLKKKIGGYVCINLQLINVLKFNWF